MAERDIAAEVLQGLREVQEYRAGTRTLRTTRVEAKPDPTVSSTDDRPVPAPDGRHGVAAEGSHG